MGLNWERKTQNTGAERLALRVLGVSFWKGLGWVSEGSRVGLGWV